MNKISFKFDDEFCKREVEFSTTLEGESIDVLIDAFRSFLLSAGFATSTINQYLPEE